MAAIAFLGLLLFTVSPIMALGAVVGLLIPEQMALVLPVVTAVMGPHQLFLDHLLLTQVAEEVEHLTVARQVLVVQVGAVTEVTLVRLPARVAMQILVAVAVVVDQHP
jgi:hypothetical protein